MRQQKYIIPGAPIPLARPRYTVRRIWDSQAQHKLVAGIHVKNQHHNDPLFEGPIAITMKFYMAKPKTSRYLSKDNPLFFHYCKPDLDNLIKFVCDIANGILYHDDCSIATINANKLYSDNPRTEFLIKELYESKKD